ncbi:MAG: chorismate-binding protein [Deltaproteobacteria bacterium]|nr:chorismate-binding protein [Deltaproteobacteria bacterium]
MELHECPYVALERSPPPVPCMVLKTARVTAQDHWSMMGWDPWWSWVPPANGDPLHAMDIAIHRLRQSAPVIPTGLPCPVPMVAGALAYDLGLQLEPVRVRSIDQWHFPHMLLYAFRRWRIVNERTKQSWEIRHARPDDPEALAATQRQLGKIRNALPRPLASNFSREAYMREVAALQDAIAAGACYQVNLSQQFQGTTAQSAAELFRRVVTMNPAPMMAFLDAGIFQVISSSPERLIQRRGTRIISEPIKGTIGRGATPEDDQQRRVSLWQSPKNRAELAMIIDLVRNDLGRVAVSGSVQVADPGRIVSYTNVHHVVATVTAEVATTVAWGALLRAVFPGGSVTGCPKIEAMSRIDAAEKIRRGYYCGALGYIDWGGHGDWNIAIRTITQVGSSVLFNLGGAVVYDSTPAAEYEETLQKGETLFAAMQ